MSHNESSCLRRQDLVLLVSLFAAWASPVFAQTCTVPGSHATIQEAIDDPACATITLSAQTYPDFVESCRSVDARPLATPPALFRALSRPPYQSGEAR